MAALLGYAAVSLGGIAIAGAVGVGCMIGADAIRDTAVLANAERKRQAAEEQYREDDAVDALVREVEAEGAKQASGLCRQAELISVPAATGMEVEQNAIGIPDAQGNHIARLRQERQNQLDGIDMAL
jgi:hypothetical protein